MADWRDRGFVPDSDDEEEFDSAGGVRPLVEADNDLDLLESGSVQSNPLPDREDTRSVDEQPVTSEYPPSPHDERLSPSSPPPGGPLTVDLLSSSPLSELASTPPGSPFTTTDPEVNRSQARAISEESLDPLSDLHRTTVQQYNGNDHGYVGEYLQRPRSLRKRNPIQLHPYILESEQYRLSLKARGLKPLRIARANGSPTTPVRSPRRRHLTDDGSSDEFFYDAAPSQGSARRYSPTESIARATGPEQRGDAVQISDAGSDQEFPDVDSLVRFRRNEIVYDKFKRRKLGRPVVELPKLNFTPQDVIDVAGETIDLDEDRASRLSRKASTSAMVGERSPLRELSSGFRVPRGFSPRPLAGQSITTPTRRQDVRPIDIADDSSSDTTSLAGSNDGMRPPSDASVADRQSTPSRPLKVKRVIPASWLMLDDRKPGLKSAQSHRTKPQSRAHHVEDTSRPGVARRKERGMDASKNLRAPQLTDLHFSDESENEDEMTPRAASTSYQSRQTRDGVAPTGSAMSVFGDIEEDNRVDEMAPSAKRQRQPGSLRKPRQKRQKRLSDFVDLDTDINRPRRTHRRTHSDRHATHRRPTIAGQRLRNLDGPRVKARRRQPAISSLSVLDVVQRSAPKDDVTPVFLRIAARKASTQRGRGRHGPLRKVMRLASRQDTEEVQSVLRDWREGTILPANDTEPDVRLDPGLIHRPPLHDRHVNHQLPLPRDESERDHVVGRAVSDATPPQDLSPTLEAPKRQHRLQAGPPLDGRENQAEAANMDRRWIFPWQIARPTARPAQLESTKTRYRASNWRTSFQTKLNRINLIHGQESRIGLDGKTVQLQRFLADEEPAQSGAAMAHNTTRQKEQPARQPRRRRKLTPQHVDADAIEFRQPVDPIIVSEKAPVPVQSDASAEGILVGLGRFGSKYTVSFDTFPLEPETFFHDSTFIGSRGLQRSLNILSRSKDDGHDVPTALVTIATARYHWGAWDESVSIQLDESFGLAIEQLGILREESRDEAGAQVVGITAFLKDVVHYVNGHLASASTDDVNSFARKLCYHVDLILDAMQSITHLQRRSACLTELSMILVLTSQACHLLRADPNSSYRLEVERLVHRTSSQLMGRLIFAGIGDVRQFYEENHRLSRRQTGIRTWDNLIEDWVIVFLVLQRLQLPNVTFWGIFNAELGLHALSSVYDVQVLERMWSSMMLILPLLEFNEDGGLETGLRFREPLDNWEAPRSLVTRVFEVYRANPGRQPATCNEYIRTLYSRCHWLLTRWGWRRCESMVGPLFDFFAVNGLAHLRNEEAHGSPAFLCKLDREQTLEVEPGDCCFHLLLKTIGLGLRGLRGIYPDKQIRNVAFRLMPNHGRQYPKQQAIRQEDLESLRNHHNLLSVLYWASPPAVRVSVNKIRDLVDAGASHREACHLSILAWTDLVRFQLFTDEPTSSLLPFREWHSYMTTQITKQHGQARIEAEQQYNIVDKQPSVGISTALLQSTVQRNQRQVELLLVEILSAMVSALCLCRQQDAAMALLDKSSTARIYELFDPGNSRTNRVVTEGLKIVQSYIDVLHKFREKMAVQQASEDSQDYGDWTALEEAATKDCSKTAVVHLQDTVHESLCELVSRAINADIEPHENLLEPLILTWVATAKELVQNNQKQWEHYLGGHSAESWFSLQHSAQKRRYTTFFMSQFLEKMPESYEVSSVFPTKDVSADLLKQNRALFMSTWLISMVERASLCKYQHDFVRAILKAGAADPVFYNMPFAFNAADGMTSLTLSTILERRISVISTVFENMQRSLAGQSTISLRDVVRARTEYGKMLRHMMTAMKSNFLELQRQKSATAPYVKFVQCVIEAMQQHTGDICVVDNFFTSSAVFPLPVADPSYVVGKLKGYAAGLSTKQTQKRLVSFTQPLFERAAFDGQQAELADQLFSAMVQLYEAGSETAPTLRYFMVHAVFPPYLLLGIDPLVGWIYTKPSLHALTKSFADLHRDVDTFNPACAQSAADILNSATGTLRLLLANMARYAYLLQTPLLVSILADAYDTATAALRMINYLKLGGTVDVGPASTCVVYFSAFARSVHKSLSRYPTHTVLQRLPHVDSLPRISNVPRVDGLSPDEAAVLSPAMEMRTQKTPPFADAREFCALNLEVTLRGDWAPRSPAPAVISLDPLSPVHPVFRLTRGTAVREYVPPVLRLENEVERMVSSMQEYEWAVSRCGGLSDYNARKAARREFNRLARYIVY
ncbi:MAG: hypothetical protein M1825_001105 [Sarcosagium campestre]|nr:MAG: hypothetical protein M1825_001105 [Sarcosagium campestre]